MPHKRASCDLIAAVLAGIVCLTPASPLSATPFFAPLGDLPGGLFESTAYGISGDGSTVVGWSRSSNQAGFFIEEAFRWTAGDGMVGLGSLGFGSVASATSFNGSVVVGTTLTSNPPPGTGTSTVGFQWTGTMQSLASPTCTVCPTGATWVSNDGSIIVGTAVTIGQNSGAFRLSPDGLQSLSGVPVGTAIAGITGANSDGTAITGTARIAFPNGIFGETQAFRWTESTGLVPLGDLFTGTRSEESNATAISADGKTIVGSAFSSDGVQAFVWRQDASAMSGLGDLAGGTFESSARAMSSDGSLIGGWGTSSQGKEAVLWDAGGMHLAKDVLASSGLNPIGWTLTEVTGISADGRTLTGNGINPLGQLEAWIANIGAAQPVPPLPLPDRVTLARLSEAAYSLAPPTIDNFTPVVGLGGSGSSGFGAQVFQKGDQVVIAFRGTEFNLSWQSLKDVLADTSFGSGTPSQQLINQIQQATDLLAQVRLLIPNANITLTGWSLGGALAQILGQASGYSAIAFNAPGAYSLISELAAYLPTNTAGTVGVNINYRNDADIVSQVGIPTGQIITLQSAVLASIPDVFAAYGFLHDIDTVISQLQSNPIEVAGLTSSDLPPFILTPIVSTIATALQVEFSVPVAFADFYIDPIPSLRYALEGDSNSPDLASLAMPLIKGVTAYLLSFETGFGWSPYQIINPIDPFFFGPDVEGFSVFALDQFGNTIPFPDAVVFDVTFSTTGNFKGLLTIEPASVPEPASIFLFLSAVLLIVTVQRQQRRHARAPASAKRSSPLHLEG